MPRSAMGCRVNPFVLTAIGARQKKDHPKQYGSTEKLPGFFDES
jgi:hypothetical protein